MDFETSTKDNNTIDVISLNVFKFLHSILETTQKDSSKISSYPEEIVSGEKCKSDITKLQNKNGNGMEGLRLN